MKSSKLALARSLRKPRFMSKKPILTDSIRAIQNDHSEIRARWASEQRSAKASKQLEKSVFIAASALIPLVIVILNLG